MQNASARTQLRIAVCLQVEGLEARVGRRGHIKVRGGLPVTPSSSSASPVAPPVEPSGTDRGAAPEGINVAVQGLELRVRNVYTGQQLFLKIFKAFSWVFVTNSSLFLVSMEGHTFGNMSFAKLLFCRC